MVRHCHERRPVVWRENVRFLWAFLRSPRTVGAVWPSAPGLARAMLVGHELVRARVVVELGPGTGAFTRLIEAAVGLETMVLAIELDGAAAARLQKKHPRVRVVNGSAEQTGDHLRACGVGQADAIVSGIPWASMPVPRQERIMTEVRAVLAPTGLFSTFSYLHSPFMGGGMAYGRLLRERFARVERSPVIWRNVPPAFVYRCWPV